jgi:gamma-glutamylcysteine synthetase
MGTSGSESAGNQTNTTGEIFEAFGVTQRGFLKQLRSHTLAWENEYLKRIIIKYTEKTSTYLSMEMNLRLV